MGTKNHPGEFDCYAAAEPEEPIFILLGRDPHAHAAVRKWAFDRQQLIEFGAKPASDMRMVIEANHCADAMEEYAMKRLAMRKVDMPEAVPTGSGASERGWIRDEGYGDLLTEPRTGGSGHVDVRGAKTARGSARWRPACRE
jgi:hypothetical protein